MAKGIGNGVKAVPSIWGSLTTKQIADAEAKAVEQAQLAGRDVEMFADLTPEERRAARRAALRNEH